MQRVRATQERNRSFRAVVHLADKRFVQLATPEFPTVNPGDDASRAIGTSDLPYQQEMSWDASYSDVAARRSERPVSVSKLWNTAVDAHDSSTGKYLLYFDFDTADWSTYRVADGVRANLTEKLV